MWLLLSYFIKGKGKTDHRCNVMSLTIANTFATCFFVVQKENMDIYMAGKSKIISESFILAKCFSN